MSARPTGAILAGGGARRFGGGAKGLAVVGGTRVVDRIASALGAVCGELLLVGASPEVAASCPALRAVADEHPAGGPLGGILSALRAARGSVLVVAWDMPFVTERELAPLVRAAGDADVVAWRHDDDIVEPLCALYRASALPALRDAWDAGERSPSAAIARVNARLIDRADGAAFESINTVDDMQRARGRAGSAN